MRVYIAKFEKIEEFSPQHKCDLTKLSIALHPVIELKDGKATVSPVGVEPVILLEGKVVDHNHVSNALRDVADMIDKELNGRTAEDLKKELETQKGDACH